MYVCICHAVTESTVEEAIHEGATSVEEVARRCGAGDRCGGCHPLIAELLAGVERHHVPLTTGTR